MLVLIAIWITEGSCERVRARQSLCSHTQGMYEDEDKNIIGKPRWIGLRHHWHL